jgi:hypothetical protein
VLTFQEPPRTGFEITWSLFGIRFRVLPSFFLISALLAYLFIRPFFPDTKTLAIGIAVDVGCIFVAIAVTEFLQGVVYRSWGIRSAVLIQEFGGGIYPEHEPPLRIQRIVAALAAPVSSLALFAVVYYSNQEFRWQRHSDYHQFAYIILYFITLFWGIIGFLPMFPYPGGRVMMELLTWVSPRNGVAWTLIISIAIGVAVIADTVMLFVGPRTFIPYLDMLHPTTRILMAVFFAIATMRNWQYLQMVRASSRRYETDDYGERAPWDR